MNIFGVQSHLYKKIGGDSIALIFVVPSRAGNRYDRAHLCQGSSLDLEPILLCCLFTLSSLWVISR